MSRKLLVLLLPVVCAAGCCTPTPETPAGSWQLFRRAVLDKKIAAAAERLDGDWLERADIDRIDLNVILMQEKLRWLVWYLDDPRETFFGPARAELKFPVYRILFFFGPRVTDTGQGAERKVELDPGDGRKIPVVPDQQGLWLLQLPPVGKFAFRPRMVRDGGDWFFVLPVKIDDGEWYLELPLRRR